MELWETRRIRTGGEALCGSITVTLTLVFVILLALVLAVIENARVLTAGGYVSTAADAAMETVFGGYNKELFDEYHLLGYGGYSGKDIKDLSGELERVLGLNLQTAPQNVKRGYSDLYRISGLSCQALNAEGVSSHEQFIKQISHYLSVSVADDITEKVLKKYKDNTGEIKDADVSDKLSKTGDYERGKYDSYFAVEDGKASAEDIKRGKEKISEGLMEDEANGNPISVMKDMIRDGVLSLVCDTSKLSDVTIEKCEFGMEDKGQTKSLPSGNNFSDTDMSDSAVSDYLGEITESGESNGIEELSGIAADKGKIIAYAQKVFSFYGNSSPQAVRYGIEYLAAGNENERDNLLSAVTKIITMRMVCNFLYVIKNPLFVEKSLATAVVLVGFTGIEPLIQALQYTILLILAFEESCIDVSALLMGKSVPLVKDASCFQMKYGEICRAGKDFFEEKAKAYHSVPVKKAAITYKQFLLLFLMTVPTKKLEDRIFDIVEFDLRDRYNQTFCPANCYAKAELEVTYKVPAMFEGLGIFGRDDREYGRAKRFVKLSYSYTK